MTDVLSTRTRHYRCEEASGPLVDLVAGKLFSATALAYQQGLLLNFSVKGNGTTAFIEQTNAAGADAHDIPLGEERTYAFYVRTSTAAVEYYLNKWFFTTQVGIQIGKTSARRLRVTLHDGVTLRTFVSAVNILPNTVNRVVIVRVRRTASGLSARVGGTEWVTAPFNLTAMGAISTTRTAMAFATRNNAAGDLLVGFSAHQEDEILVWDSFLTDADCLLIENGGVMRDLSQVPVLTSVDVTAAFTLDDAFTQVVTGDNFDLQAPTFAYAGLGAPTSVVVNSRYQATVTWDLTGETPGTYALEASNANGAATPLAAALVLTQAFTVLVPSRFDAIRDPFNVLIPSRYDSRLFRIISILQSRADALTLRGWEVYATDTATGLVTYMGFIDGDASPKEIVDFPLPDGVYEIEARPSDFFWKEPRVRRVATLITDPQGGGDPATGLPVIQNLRSEVVNFTTRIRWDVAREAAPEDFRFGLWFGPTAGVDTSGPPDLIVQYRDSVGVYERIYAQAAQEYLAVAAFTDVRQGEVSEILLPWDLVAPDSPAGQHADMRGPSGKSFVTEEEGVSPEDLQDIEGDDDIEGGDADSVFGGVPTVDGGGA